MRLRLTIFLASCLCLLIGLSVLSSAGLAGWNEWTTNGPYGGNVRSLALSPTFATDPTDQTLFAGTSGSGVFKSTDGGASWNAVNNDLTNTYVASLAVSATFATDQTLFAGTDGGGVSNDGGGVFKSTNGGASWSAVNTTGLTNTNVTSLALSPNFATDHTLFAGTTNWGSGNPSGVYRSTDAGDSWSAVNFGLTGSTNVASLAVSPNFATDRTLFAGTGGGVFKSTDGGANWSAVNTTGAISLALSPTFATGSTDQTLFAGTYGDGVFKSTDAGAIWSAVNNGLTNTIVRLALSPNFATDQTLFAGTDGGGVFESTDGGANWSAVNTGLTNTNVNSLAVSPNFTADQTLFAGTDGDGVFSYTADNRAITAFTIPGQIGGTTIDQSAHTIALTMPYGTNVAPLVPTITITGASVAPASGVAHNFTSPSTYTVTAADSSTQDYTVTVAVAPTNKAIIGFTIPSQVGTSTINESAHTIAITMPYGTNVTALVPTITHSGASLAPASDVAHNFTGPSTYTVTAEDSSIQGYTVTVGIAPDPVHNYYWTWYDNVGGDNWVLMANPLSAPHDLAFDLSIGGVLRDLTAYNNGVVGPGESIAPKYVDVVDGPVKAATTTTGGEGIVSQRILWPKGGNSLEEVLGIDADDLSDHYFWTWYDQLSPGFTNWILIANPSGSEAVTATIAFTNMADGVKISASRNIAAGENWTPTFPGKRGGPVEVKASLQGSTWPTNPRDVIASQRVLSNYGVAFNEVPGIAETDLTNSYLWTWYDMQSPGYSDWVLIANPNDAQVTYQIKIAGVPMDLGGGQTTGVIPGHGKVTPTFAGKMDGPVEVTASNKVIASQRVIAGPSFEEVPGYPTTALTNDYHWTWYDQKSAGATDWVLVANPTDDLVTYQIKIAGTVMPTSPGNPGTILAHDKVVPTFPGTMNGPVEVITGGGKVMVSQRVLWNGYFNETLGTVLNECANWRCDVTVPPAP